jgi:hypothetical protein
MSTVEWEGYARLKVLYICFRSYAVVQTKSLHARRQVRMVECLELDEGCA